MANEFKIKNGVEVFGDVIFKNASLGTISLRSPSVTTDYIYTLPSSDGSAYSSLITNGNGILDWEGQTILTDGLNKQTLSTDGSGNLIWEYVSILALDTSSASSRIPFYSDNSTLSTTPNFTYNKDTSIFSINADVSVGRNVQIKSTNWMYFGEPSTNGSWRMGISGSNFIIQKNESGTYNTKGTFS